MTTAEILGWVTTMIDALDLRAAIMAFVILLIVLVFIDRLTNR